MTVKVKGETYRDAAELVDEIGRLNATLADMPEGADKLSLAKHVEDLESALALPSLPGRGTEDGPEDAAPARPVASNGPSSDDDEEDDENELPEGAEPVCPMCNGLGVLAVDPPDDPNSQRCQSCQGFGKVYTGSRVPGHEVKDCATCQGQGYTPVGPFVAGVTRDESAAATVPAQAGALWNDDARAWDRPPGQQPPWAGATWKPLLGGWE